MSPNKRIQNDFNRINKRKNIAISSDNSDKNGSNN